MAAHSARGWPARCRCTPAPIRTRWQAVSPDTCGRRSLAAPSDLAIRFRGRRIAEVAGAEAQPVLVLQVGPQRPGGSGLGQGPAEGLRGIIEVDRRIVPPREGEVSLHAAAP